MSKISCFIVEDDPQAYRYATSIIQNYKEIVVIGNSASINESAKQIKKLNPDFIILDVFLEDGNAFEFLELFDEISFKIIFTTSFAKYAIEAFKFSALDYLLKPYEEKELIVALEKVKENLSQDNYRLQLQTLFHNFSQKDQPKKIILKNADAIHITKIDDIVYAKADNNYTTFYLTNTKEILVSKPLKTFNDKLQDYNFFRVHQSYLINLNHIVAFDKRSEQIILNPSHTIPVAKSRKRQLMDFIEKLR